MSRTGFFLFRRAGRVLAAVGILALCGVAGADGPAARAPLTKEQFAGLFQNQPVVADAPIFDGDAFPRVDFLYRDLVVAALGPYSLSVRFFDAGWNEVQKPVAPGRYGALVEIHFPNGLSDTRRLTLFKTPAPYNPAKDPYRVFMQFPAAFGLPKDVLEREEWSIGDYVDEAMNAEAGHNEKYAILVAALHDFAADPARWHGFYYWRIEDAWWDGLGKKLGEPQDYPRLVGLPPDYDRKPGVRWPLILFLHGSGERGTNLDQLKNWGPQGYINQGHPLPFVVVTPQCPKDEWWSPDRLIVLLNEIEARYRIDPKRIYVTGLSMGGYGTLDLAASYPDRIAAIAPLSGGESPDIAERLKTVPAWIFHGAEDGTVPTRYSIDIADRMKALGAEVKLTVYPGVGHSGWDKTYANPALYAWFLQHELK